MGGRPASAAAALRVDGREVGLSPRRWPQTEQHVRARRLLPESCWERVGRLAPCWPAAEEGMDSTADGRRPETVGAGSDGLDESIEWLLSACRERGEQTGWLGGCPPGKKGPGKGPWRGRAMLLGLGGGQTPVLRQARRGAHDQSFELAWFGSCGGWCGPGETESGHVPQELGACRGGGRRTSKAQDRVSWWGGQGAGPRAQATFSLSALT